MSAVVSTVALSAVGRLGRRKNRRRPILARPHRSSRCSALAAEAPIWLSLCR